MQPNSSYSPYPTAPMPAVKRKRTGWIVTGSILGALVLICGLITIIAALVNPTSTGLSAQSSAIASQQPAIPVSTDHSTNPAPTPSPTVTAGHVVTTTSPASPKTTTHKPVPTSKPKPTHKPTPPPSTCGAPANPYGFNFCGRGHAIYSSDLPGGVCSYFDCIPNFSNGHGYMVECHDTTYSMSGGIQGACSHHSGEWREVYSG